MKKVYSILVAYNPQVDELFSTVERLKAQTDIVVVCNNSDFDVNIKDETVKIFNFNENLGIAKAQSIGMKWAFENGADFIVQMDQDSIPSEGMIQKLLMSYFELVKKGYKVGLIAPQDYDKDTHVYSQAIINKEIDIYGTSCCIVPDILSSGSLIPKKTYQINGVMDNDLFIDIVDFEYCWRIKDHNHLIIKDKSALLAHKLGDGQKKLFLLFNINLGSTFRHYYQFRNILFMMNRDYVPLKWKISQIIKLFIKLFLYPIGLPDGFERFKFMFLGIKDFILNRKGKIK